MKYSSKWKMLKATLDLKTCLTCQNKNGKIYGIGDRVYPSPPFHQNCRCIIERLKALLAGIATKKEIQGADWYLKSYGKLPSYYITKENAEKLGYRSYLGNLSKVAPNQMLFKGIYQNKNQHLPTTPNRIWYEADINYESDFRGMERIIFSNDGLIFVTYDHYTTFIAVE